VVKETTGNQEYNNHVTGYLSKYWWASVIASVASTALKPNMQYLITDRNMSLEVEKLI